MRLKITLAATAFLALAAPALAVTPDEMLADPDLEARARAVSSELRCVVCQNQSIDDSNAPLAHDMRVLVRERIVAGDTDAAVKSYLVRRYGNYVLLRPPFQANTLILWAAPLAFLGFSAAGFGLYFRSARFASTEAGADLSDEERQRLTNLQSGLAL